MQTTQGVKLDINTIHRLKILAEIRDRSPHWLMKTAIESYLEREEQYEREKAEDTKRWEAYQVSGKALSQASVTNWLTNLANGKAEACPK